jgi:hypothetical protein
MIINEYNVEYNTVLQNTHGENYDDSNRPS